MEIKRKPARFFYFAYGPTMNPATMAQVCRGAVALGTAMLPGHELAFFGHSEVWDGAEKTLVRRPGAVAWGVVYQIASTDLDRLDLYQGVKLDGSGGYFHYPTEVFGADGQRYEVVFYKRAMNGTPSLPSTDYVARIIAGTEAHGLPNDYIDRLRRAPTRRASYSVPLRRIGVVSEFSCAC
ncbi:MAG: gamma-glutamylcyclotransferase [Methylacidiphilales bacterium]|nr:gamma-glutamylcyclotransferase [Candidatus Methylacidiphilales bacterium]